MGQSTGSWWVRLRDRFVLTEAIVSFADLLGLSPTTILLGAIGVIGASISSILGMLGPAWWAAWPLGVIAIMSFGTCVYIAVAKRNGGERSSKSESAALNSPQLQEGMNHDVLLSAKWQECHNVGAGRIKLISFESDGTVGDGSSDHEAKWYLIDSMLVIERPDGDVNNRYIWKSYLNRFVSTDEQTSFAVREMKQRGQYIERVDAGSSLAHIDSIGALQELRDRDVHRGMEEVRVFVADCGFDDLVRRCDRMEHSDEIYGTNAWTNVENEAKARIEMEIVRRKQALCN